MKVERSAQYQPYTVAYKYPSCAVLYLTWGRRRGGWRRPGHRLWTGWSASAGTPAWNRTCVIFLSTRHVVISKRHASPWCFFDNFSRIIAVSRHASFFLKRIINIIFSSWNGGRIIDNLQIDNPQIDNRQIDNLQNDNQNLQIDYLQINFLFHNTRSTGTRKHQKIMMINYWVGCYSYLFLLAEPPEEGLVHPGRHLHSARVSKPL